MRFKLHAGCASSSSISSGTSSNVGRSTSPKRFGSKNSRLENYAMAAGLTADSTNSKDFWCSSPYTQPHKEISIFIASLAYYVDGDSDRAKQLKIVLTVHDMRGAHLFNEALQITSAELSRRALGLSDLPSEVSQAILEGKSGKWKTNKVEIEVFRENYVNIPGYDLKFMIR